MGKKIKVKKEYVRIEVLPGEKEIVSAIINIIRKSTFDPNTPHSLDTFKELISYLPAIKAKDVDEDEVIQMVKENIEIIYYFLDINPFKVDKAKLKEFLYRDFIDEYIPAIIHDDKENKLMYFKIAVREIHHACKRFVIERKKNLYGNDAARVAAFICLRFGMMIDGGQGNNSNLENTPFHVCYENFNACFINRDLPFKYRGTFNRHLFQKIRTILKNDKKHTF